MSTSFEGARQKTDQVEYGRSYRSCWSAAVTISVLPLSVRNRSRVGFLLSVVIFGWVPSGFPRGSVQIYSGRAVKWRSDAKGWGPTQLQRCTRFIFSACHVSLSFLFNKRLKGAYSNAAVTHEPWRTSMHGCQRIFDSSTFKPLPLFQSALSAIIESGIARDWKSRPINSKDELHFLSFFIFYFFI